jgi:hypothetical protein
MSTPSIKVGQGNWGIKAGNLLAYANTEKKFVARDFTVGRLLDTATRVNASGNIEIVNANIPRIDYFGGQASLLVEPAGTNFARGVELLNTPTPATASGGITITTGSTDFLAPDGSSGTITKYVGGTASGANFVEYVSSISVSASGVHTFSAFVKTGATNPLTFCALQFALYSAASGTNTSYFNLASGTALTAGATIQNYGNGWYRIISAPYTIAAGDLAGSIRLIFAEANNDVNWPASGALDLTVYAWGIQLEAGSVATSYIPTTTGSVTRNADAISVTGVAGLIGQTEGTIYAEVDVRVLGDGRFATLSDGTSNNRIQCRFNAALNGLDFLVVVSASSVGFSISNSSHPSFPATIPAGTYKIALGYKQNDYVVAMNGVAYTPTVTTRNVPLSFSKVTLGADVSDLNQFNNRIRAVSIYQTRLPNTTTDGSPSLQSITTL